jgi:nucleoside-diphosphate-sugar epimerase
MRILVTGGTGKVGSEVIKVLAKSNVSVRALVRKQEASTKMPEGVEVILGDLLDPVSVGLCPVQHKDNARRRSFFSAVNAGSPVQWPGATYSTLNRSCSAVTVFSIS